MVKFQMHHLQKVDIFIQVECDRHYVYAPLILMITLNFYIHSTKFEFYNARAIMKVNCNSKFNCTLITIWHISI